MVDGEVTGQSTLPILRRQKFWGLCTHDHQVVNFFLLVGGGFQHLKNSGNMHEILLSGYFRGELQQRIWGQGLPQESPIASCSVTELGVQEV